MARSDSPRPASSGTAVGHRKPRTASTPPSGLALARPAAAPDAQRLARRTRVVIAGAAEAVVLVDAQGCIQHTNRQAAGLFGYTRQMLVGEPFHMLVPDWLPRDPAAAAGTPSARNRRSHDARACFGHHRDGHEFPIYLAATALPRAADGLVVIAIRQVQMWLPDDDDVAPDAVRRQERHTATALTRTLAFIRSRLALDRHSEALRAAKATETQLRGLQTLTDTALAHLDLDDLLPALLDQVREVMGVDHAIVLLLEEDGQHLRVRMARGPEAVLVADVQATVGVSFIGRIAATREPLIIEDVMSLPFPIQRSRRRARSAAGVPLLLQGRLVGVLSVTATEQQRFTRQDVELLQRVAERVTIAIERSQRYEDERRARAEAEAARAEAQIARAEADAARAQAQRQAEQLDRMIEAVADGVTVWDDAGRLVRTNAALRQMMALDSAPPDYFEQPPRERMALYAPRDAQGHLLAAEDWPATRALRGEVLTGADAVDLHMRTFEGRELVFTASAGPLRDQDGHIVGAVGILRDQTERNRLVREREAALVASEAWFHTLADTAPVLIWASGPDGLLTFVNQPSLQFAGRSLEDELVGGWADGLHPDDHDRCLQTYQAAFQTRERFTAEYRVRHANGEYRWVVGTGVPRFAPDGTFLGYIGSAMDVSEPKRLERALAEQAEQLDRIVEAMGEGLFVYDTQGQVVRTNAAARRLLGWDTAPPDIAHLPADERIALYAPREEQGSQLATPAEWLAERAQASGDGEILSETEARDIRMRALDGRELEVSASMAPLRTPDGQVAGGVLLLSDRTERNQLLREREEARASELALREVNERLDTFVTMAAHDLRSPVAVSRMVVQRAQHLLGQAAAGADPLGSTPTRDVIRAAQALATTEGNLDRLWRLVQQLLDVSRAREGTLVLNRQRVDLADVVRTCVEEQRLLVPSRVFVLDPPDADTDEADTVEAGRPSDVVDADADRLGQVLTNYLANAVRYSPEDQPIEVALRVVEPAAEDGGRRVARVAVRDYGPGIAAEEQATIWDRFQQAHSVAEAQGGLGLGLYIARSIIERHGGQVGVESVVGEGATFWFTLPLAPAEG